MLFGETPIGELARRAAGLNDNKIWLLSANTRVIKDLIIKLNTEVQLFNQNIDSKGVKLSATGGNYSPVTLIVSRRKGRPKKGLDAINLFDTGDFYESFVVIVNARGITIEADTDKGDNDLEDRWGQNIIGLTDENWGIVSEQIKENFIRITRQQLGIS